MSDSDKTVKRMAIIIIVLVVFFYLENLFSEPVAIPAAVATTSVASASGEGQEIELSWGRFNYKPESITVKQGVPVRIKGDLTRLQGCFRSFVIPEFGVSTYFSSRNDVVEFTPTQKGTFRFSCSMGMGNGRLIVT